MPKDNLQIQNQPPWEPRPLVLGLLQFAMSRDKDENLETALRLTERAAEKGAQIVCWPELFRSPYFCVTPTSEIDYSEDKLEALSDRLSQAAASLGIALVAGSIYEKTAKGELFNTSLVYDADGSQLGYYRKTHIPQDPSFYELDYFRPGDTGFRVFETKFAKISVLICYDQWFPEAARSVALQGADIVFYPTAIASVSDLGEHEGSWQKYWERVQQGHAAANNLIVAAVNRIGTEGKSRFWGGSFVANAVGEILRKAGDQEEVLLVDVDLAHSAYTREGWRFFKSRCPGHYKKLTDV